MEEAFAICDMVLIMDKGKAVCQGPPAKLLEQNIEKYVLELTGAIPPETIGGRQDLKSVRVDKGQETTRLYSDDVERLKQLAAQLEGAHYYLRQTNLEDVFLKETGRELNE